MTVLGQVDKLGDDIAAAAKSGNYTEQGLREAKLQMALAAAPTYKRSRTAIANAKEERDALREKVKLPSPDPKDLVAFLRRQEIRNFVRAMPQEERSKYFSKHAAEPEFAQAIIEQGAEFSGVHASDRDMLIDQTLEALHGPALAELRDLEQAIEVAETAVEAARVEAAHEAEVWDPHKWDELAAPHEAKAAFVPFLKRYRFNGSEQIKVFERDPKANKGWMRDATAAEIEQGRFFNSYEEWAEANRGHDNASRPARRAGEGHASCARHDGRDGQ
jgi:hypothetical protein